MTKTNMPVPFGVKASVGTTRPPLTEEDLDHLHGDSPTVLARSSNTKVLAIAGSVNDEMDLTETGWGVLFASDADPSIKEKLQPLLDLRRKQVQDDKLFKVFEGPAGVQPGQSAESWARSKGVALSAPVEPRKGVPFYLLLVGSPARIPFEFQALLDLQWAVGRLHFDNVEDYGSYARNITEYEKDGFKPVQRKSAVSWLTRNPADVATAMLSGAINGDFLDEDNTLGARQHFSYRSFSAEQATKSQLQDVLRGKIAEGPPAIYSPVRMGLSGP